MLAMARAVTSPGGMMPTGGSRSTSTNLGTHKQAVTPAKPWDGVGSHTSTKACIGGEGSGRVGAFGRETDSFMDIIWGVCLSSAFGLGVLVGQGISPAATTGWDGCNTFYHPTNFGALLSSTGASGKLVGPGVCRLSSSLGRGTPLKTSSSMKERYHLYLLLQHLNTSC